MSQTIYPEASRDEGFIKVLGRQLSIASRDLWIRLKKNRWTSFSTETVRPMLILIHAMALSALFFRPTLKDLLLFVGLYLATGFGITVGFHRLLTHRGFDSPSWFTALLAFLGTAAMQGGPLWWVSVHRKHHQQSDREADPHSPAENFVHGHMGWMFRRGGLTAYPKLVRDLATNRFLVLLDSGPLSAVPWLTTVAFCYLVDGMHGVVWGAAVRTVFVWHATWCVNSVCHRLGSKPHKLRDNSGNVWWVGLWALGEGWHNNHHAHPRAAIHTFSRWQVDPSAYFLAIVERLGLARNIIRSGPRATVVDPASASVPLE
jgi:fatty-acid desaturase